MIFDSHSHTEFSGDSEMKGKDALKAAAKQGLGLVFTEHLDFDYPGDIDFTFDPVKYWQQYEPLRDDKLHLGVEVGMQLTTSKCSQDFVKKVPFDMVIGSLHLLAGQDLYYQDIYAGKDKPSVYHDYYQSMAENIYQHDFIDVLGHIDYIARYAPFPNSEVEYGNFADDIDAVLKAVIATDTVLELNTRRLGDRLALKELVPVYKRYYELGGRFITLGSDAHNISAIGMNFAMAEEFAEFINLQIVTFAQRKLVSCSK